MTYQLCDDDVKPAHCTETRRARPRKPRELYCASVYCIAHAAGAVRGGPSLGRAGCPHPAGAPVLLPKVCQRHSELFASSMPAIRLR
jgi:hypothetical protein